MRKFILLIIIVLLALAVIYRDRLFLRDPLGKLERDGVAVPDARVFINYSNDILVQEDGGRHMFVVQNYNKLPDLRPDSPAFRGCSASRPLTSRAPRHLNPASRP